MAKRLFFTSESVTEGHPDKVADQISDSILDAILAKDPYGRVACETMVTTGQAHIAGEISTKCYVDIAKIVRDTVRKIGYTRAKFGFDADTCGILVSLDEQSPDIAQGVDKALEAREGNLDEEEATGAGDQGMMFGYATNETPEYLPVPIALAHRLARRLAEVRKNGTLPYLRPDGKTQVTVAYENGKPVAIDTIVISTQHDESVTLEQIAYAARYVAKNIVAAGLADKAEVQLAYAIGVATPVSIMVDTFGTGKVSDRVLEELVTKNFDLRPAGIIKMLDLRRPIYAQTAAYGHFGRTDVDLPWEHTDKAEALKAQAGF